MSNLTVENLSHIVNTGDADRLMGRSEADTEARVAKEAPELVKDTGGKTFSDTLRDSVDKVNQMQVEANTDMNMRMTKAQMRMTGSSSMGDAGAGCPRRS